jgi:LmbE family N-acetylglucosaminyl deacetylase
MAESILVIAPHPDDEILGCGGVIARHISGGDEVTVCIISNHDAPIYTSEHREITKQEARSAHKLLGIKETIFLDYAAVTLNDLPVYERNGAIGKVVKSVEPTVVYIPHAGDMHIDHRLVAESALVAVRPLANCSIREVYAYETLSETEWNAPRAEYAFIPNHFVDISKYLAQKLEAMSCFKSQLYDAPHPRSLEALSNLAKMRGATISVKAAEAFMLIRSVIRQDS